jgi:DNA-binding YbaB/EbfC family protein
VSAALKGKIAGRRDALTGRPGRGTQAQTTTGSRIKDRMKDLMGMMKQVGQMQARMQKVQEELESLEIDGKSGGGLVVVTLSGKADFRRIRIDPSLMKPDDAEILEDLIVAAAQDAKGKVEAAMQEKMQEVTGGLPLPPGLKLF